MSNSSKKLPIAISSIVLAMFLFSFASVPLYSLFCKVTGYGGTPQINISKNMQKGNRKIEVYFNSDVARNLNWEFKPKQRKIKTLTGERNLVFYQARNLSKKTITGTATYNVTPFKAGKYFSKIDCFCFSQQVLKGGENTELPVSFYIDPEIENDPFLKDVSQITLSYSFFPYEE